MDLDLHDALDTGFGAEPPHRPLSARLEAGHRAVRRRRLAASLGCAAVVAAVALGAATLGGGGTVGNRVADDATPTSTTTSPEEGWDDAEVARYSDDGQVEVRPGATVLQRIDDPLADPSDFNHSVALAVEFQGAETWLILDWKGNPEGSISATSALAEQPTGGTFAQWVEDQVAAKEDKSAGYVRFTDDGSLVSTHGVEIVEQRVRPDLPANFAPAGSTTAAALLQGPDGKKWWVLVRDFDGLDTIGVPFRTGGPTMDDFLAFARQKYVSGEGLR
jgi:hypothetical protein